MVFLLQKNCKRIGGVRVEKKIDGRVIKRSEYEFVPDWKIAQMIEPNHRDISNIPHGNRTTFTGTKKPTNPDDFSPIH